MPTNYIFFANVNTPYLENKVNIHSPRSALPLWQYSPDTRKFTAWDTHTSLFSHVLPILSIEILENDKVMYDLTDFIETIRVYNTQSSPSLGHILHAWILSSELVLDPNRNFMIRYVTDDADTFTVSFNTLGQESDPDVDLKKID